MLWPFLYLPGDRLSEAELCAARLDGDLIEVGEAFMPADAAETRELRAGSLRALVPPKLALARVSAAWVHGALSEPPARHTVQRMSSTRIHHVIDVRLVYRDQALCAADVVRVSGVAVTTPEKTLSDLVRGMYSGEDVGAVVEAMLAWQSGLAARTVEHLARDLARQHKRPALAFLRERAQDEVTR
ncbi:MAG: type IV toxin-antitoxin system AbiEi family antitoxin [Microbacterium sp.]